ncbi:MAG: shikimate kinase [SAR324 cluster bacterium]|nr:shikimate kinase [SAR324 cluster bacterium]MBL7035879.1 shikimate kinase [SAR324 cluster bacterium]
MNIILIGFMGSGKTTIGRKLAHLLEYTFIDTDSEIEDDQSCSVTEIFKYGGEECFREMETRLLKKISNTQNSIIATGGGIVLRKENRKLLQKIGKRVYLRVPVEELLQRLKNVQNRPLLKQQKPELVFQKMQKERNLLYEDAECIIDTGQRSPHQIATEIIQELYDKEYDHNL